MTRPAKRLHDLPVAWDGHPVSWRGWESDRTSLDYHLPLDELACRTCGSLEGQLVNAGVVHQHGARDQLRLFAFRCADCQVDQVYDVDGDRLWDLDDTDYGPTGSADPGPSDPLDVELEDQAEAAAERPPATSTTADGLRELPAAPIARSTCHGCGRPIVWATTVAGPNGPGNKLQPFDPREDLAGRIAITQPVARGRLLARALHKGENIDRPLEYAGMTHFATCPVGAHPAPPIALLEHQTRHLSRRGGRRR